MKTDFFNSHWNRFAASILLLCGMSALGGCAAFDPMDGVPARFLADDLKPETRSNKKTIDWTVLGQTPPTEYRMDKGDVLAIYIEGIMDSPRETPPIFNPANDEDIPTIGFPFKVREDGTISLPPNKTIQVRGLTEAEIENKIRETYIAGENPLIVAGTTKIIVGLRKKRQYTVTVFRQERNNDFSANGLTGSFNEGGIGGGVLNNKRGMGRVIQLPAGHNDVLHALAETGGPPGEDAENVIYVVRRKQRCKPCNNSSTLPTKDTAYNSDFGHTVSNQLGWGHCNLQLLDNAASITAPHVIRIPIRITPGEELKINEEDITLQEGDHIFIEHRDYDVFYTGGLLGGSIIRLPRDRDLDVLEAISIAHDPADGSGGLRQLGGPSNLNRDVTIGASNLIVIRRRSDGTQFPIKVDLKEALKNPAERIRIQEGDFLFLQYTKEEATFAFFERHFIDWTAVALAFAAFN